MGIKGNKLTQDSERMAELLKEKLDGIDGITTKKMFGGHGVFHNGKMFGMVDSKAQVYFKMNESNQMDFEQNKLQRHPKMPYFLIPETILNDADGLLEWGRKALPGKAL